MKEYETIEAVIAHGGRGGAGLYPEGDLGQATVRDPVGNEIGIWQQGPPGVKV